jgi:hypothetical protein
MPGEHDAHVVLLIGEDTQHITVPAGDTQVSALKVELSVPASDVLYQVHGHQLRLLGDHETVHVRSGDRFEAIPAGGVS